MWVSGEQLERAAINLLANRGGYRGVEAQEVWKALSEAQRQTLKSEALGKMADYARLSPAEKEMERRTSLAETLRENDRLLGS